uniref:Uncharacterized protein n=1 Tax=Arundo donax TaxID=35708 RepID=A0A0A9AZ33_ARUDO
MFSLNWWASIFSILADGFSVYPMFLSSSLSKPSIVYLCETVIHA